MIMGLLYRHDSMVKCVCVKLGSSGFYDWRSHCQMIGQYRTCITSSVGHPMSDSMLLHIIENLTCEMLENLLQA
jgi:hypothetical protein